MALWANETCLVDPLRRKNIIYIAGKRYLPCPSDLTYIFKKKFKDQRMLIPRSKLMEFCRKYHAKYPINMHWKMMFRNNDFVAKVANTIFA